VPGRVLSWPGRDACWLDALRAAQPHPNDSLHSPHHLHNPPIHHGSVRDNRPCRLQEQPKYYLHPVNVNADPPAAFEDFLKTFKSSSAETADALQDLRLDDDLDNEYDFMDESGDEGGARRIDPKLKYMRILQRVADRDQSQILIDLDDLVAVWINP
jgi:hypothetical protein